MDVNPIELHKHLKGVSYPTRRDDLVAAAKGNGAPRAIVDVLQGASTESFSGPDHVQRALS